MAAAATSWANWPCTWFRVALVADGHLLVGLRERLDLRGLRLGLRGRGLLRGLLGLQARFRLQQRGLVPGEIADDLVRVLVALLVLCCRLGEVGGEPGLRRAVHVGRDGVSCDEPPVGVHGGTLLDEARSDRLQCRLRVLDILLCRVVLLVEDGGLLLLLGQRRLHLADLGLGGVDLRLVRRRPGQGGGRRRTRVRCRRRQRHGEQADDHGHPDKRYPPADSVPTIHCIHGASA